MAEQVDQDLGEIRLNFRIPFGLPSMTAQHMFVQDAGEFVQLSFYEIVFPIVNKKTAEQDIAAIQASGLVAECVGKINVPRGRFKEFASAMNLVVEGMDKIDAELNRDNQ